MSRGGQALPVSSVIDSKNLSEMLKRADEFIVYDNTAHLGGFRGFAQFNSGSLCKPASAMPDWVAKVSGKAKGI